MKPVDVHRHDEREWLVRALDFGVFVADESKVGDGPAGFRVRALAALPVEVLVYHRIELHNAVSGTTSAVTLLNAYSPQLEEDAFALVVGALSAARYEEPVVFVTRDATGAAATRRPDCDLALAAAAVAASKCLFGWDESVPIAVAIAEATWEVAMTHTHDDWWTARVARRFSLR